VAKAALHPGLGIRMQCGYERTLLWRNYSEKKTKKVLIAQEFTICFRIQKIPIFAKKSIYHELLIYILAIFQISACELNTY
jgi:hypothetical protein